MSIPSGSVSLDRFLEIRNAAAKRLSKPAAAKIEKAVSPKKVDKKPAADAGLLSVYGINKFLGADTASQAAKEASLKTKYLGNFFDRVA